MPEFFNNLYPSKSPDVYKEYRNFIVSLSQMQPDTYLTATTCRRHLSGDACAILRVHQFLERHGLINFVVKPDEKPLSKDLIRESSYNKVFINAANKHFIEKNENEYFHNLFDSNSVITSAESPHENSINKISDKKQINLDASCIRKINLLSTKERPTCSFCNTLTGFSWYQSDDLFLCSKCFTSESFP